MTNMASPVVSISEGQIRGCIREDFDGQQFYSFLGIPYAKPPLGELRFKAPQPVESWSGIKDALKEGDSCMQRELIKGTILGSEDCLHLNVFTRTLPDQKSMLKPVMVWIHGGAFTQGSGNIDVYGPDYIMTEDVVLVSINYRVGYLGFLRLEDLSLEVPGNAGLKDQVFALRWVQRNIENFNGDPNNVTIFGQSAGGASVHYLVLSPSAKGLFHKAIVQSGAVLNPWAWTDSNIFDFLDFMGIGVKDEKMALEVLMKLSIKELMEYQDKFLISKPPLLGVVGPVIEKPNPTAFLDKNPMELMASGEYNKVPMMMGYTNLEGLAFIYFQQLAKDEKFNQIDNQPNLEDFVLPYMKLEKDCSANQQICKKIADFYFQEENAKNRIMLLGDYHFMSGLLISAIQHSKTSDLPVFLYRISCETNLNFGKNLFKFEDSSGVSHGDDIGYLFKNTTISDKEIGEIENVCLRRFLKLWTNFARYGNPTPDGSDLNIQWKPMEEGNKNFLDIGRELTMHTNPEEDRIKCWRDILELSPATAKYL